MFYYVSPNIKYGLRHNLYFVRRLPNAVSVKRKTWESVLITYPALVGLRIASSAEDKQC